MRWNNLSARRIKKISCVFFALGVAVSAMGQIDTSLLRRVPQDTSKLVMNMDAIYNRPSLQIGKLPISLGGYVEADWQHLSTDGVSEGHQFQFRRLSIFLSASISKRIKFLSEVEFEPAEDAIALEFAALDVEIHPLLNFRGGMVVNPIGAFNQNHDGPKWEFTDRPIAAEQMLPDTWSNAGFGFYGKYYKKEWMIGYEFYLTGNFDNAIIDNPENKTFLPAAKANPKRFEKSASGEPLINGKIAVGNSRVGEIGLSYMGGVYNKWQVDGVTVDKKRSVYAFDIDFNTTIKKTNTNFKGEWAWIFVDIPPDYTQQYGARQQGGYMDIVQPVLRRRMLGWEDAVLNLACRLEYVDWNVGKFTKTGENIADDVWSVMPAISFRPNSLTVFRLNYRFQMQTDILGNPPAKTAGFSLGISSYF